MSYERRTRCGSCQSEQVITILDMGDSPPANGDDDTKYPLQLGVCTSCSLLQQMTVLPDEQLFGGTYHFYSSASEPKVEYHRMLAAALWDEYLAQKDKPVVIELACNDGDLLRHFKNRGAQTLGVEPARGPANVAQERGLDVLHMPFSRDLVGDLLDMYALGADLIIANHVLAHIVDINDFAAGITKLLSHDGFAVIEVQYAQDMIVGNQFDHVYHEHRYHYTVNTLNELFSRYGLYLHDVRWVDTQGGSIRAVFTKVPKPAQASVDERVQTMLRGEYWMRHPHAYAHNIQGRMNWIGERLKTLVKQANNAQLNVAGYGATAKSVSFMNFCKFTRDDISYVVDTTPHKAGRMIPGTNIPIIAPGDTMTRPDVYVMWAWNYASYILRKEMKFTQDGGAWIIPTPYPTVI